MFGIKMATIIIRCDICKKEYSVRRTEEIPENCTYLTCNWCPDCEDKADDYYTEKHHFDELPIKDPNQLKLFT